MMLTIDLTALDPEQVHLYAVGYADALDDFKDRNRRNADAIAALEAELADARKDVDYWCRIANPTAVSIGPSHVELEQQRREQMITRARPNIIPWVDVPTRIPGTSGAA
ncbi:hypothetical protein [Agromyces sp. Soil535]|uniref:hypothetical protein n=1 Tax=Agromyces sp. Soil535 TaxID=1736390 RepID=UPI0007005B90|nr:hypothetical protein [Agromyces sp. Soil535]KRE28260.1 hypothetical protein ASG80_21515 [Agromyces sp. Soil535]